MLAEIAAEDDEVRQLTMANDFIASLGEQRRRVALARWAPVQALQERGWSYVRIAQATGLTRNAIGQIRMEARGRPRRRPQG